MPSGCDKAYSTMEMRSKAAAQIQDTNTFCFVRNIPLRFPSAVRTKKDLWRAIMRSQYGEHDPGQRCWRTNYQLEGDTAACMRPLRLDVRQTRDGWRYYLVAGSRDLDIAGHP